MDDETKENAPDEPQEALEGEQSEEADKDTDSDKEDASEGV